MEFDIETDPETMFELFGDEVEELCFPIFRQFVRERVKAHRPPATKIDSNQSLHTCAF